MEVVRWSAETDTLRRVTAQHFDALLKKLKQSMWGHIQYPGDYWHITRDVCSIINETGAFHLVPKVLAYEKARMTRNFPAYKAVMQARELVNMCSRPSAYGPVDWNHSRLCNLISIVAFYYAVSLAKSEKDIDYAKHACYIFPAFGLMTSETLAEIVCGASTSDAKHACIVMIYMSHRDLFERIIPDAMKPQTIVRGLEQLDRIRDAYRANRPDVISEIQKEPNFIRMWHFIVE